MRYAMNWLRDRRGVEVIRTAIPRPNVRGKDMDVLRSAFDLAPPWPLAVVGIERSPAIRPGSATHVLVALGAAMFSLSGAYGFADVTHGPNVDPARIAAQVASGIGFIGAGAIIRDRGAIKGLTTAATVWLAASCGVAAGGRLVSGGFRRDCVRIDHAYRLEICSTKQVANQEAKDAAGNRIFGKAGNPGAHSGEVEVLRHCGNGD